MTTKWELRGGIWVPSSEPIVTTGFWDRVAEELAALDMAREEAKKSDRELKNQIERDGNIHAKQLG